MAESERTLRTNLQALRERNIECEDLKEEVCKLQVMVALAAEKEEDVTPDSPSDTSESQSETLFSETSAFSRVPAVIPKENSNAVQEGEQSSVAELLSGLGGTVTELISTLKLVHQCKDAKLQELHNTM
ncbi:hypothetical protein GOODEAATRI_005073 [Goodea atripinnis]|uniref:Uncharacterized protein n=1 Tax=Goodea atripinnis TaxID=208336 RepID=A0ABV0N9F3_9TELE